MNFFLCARPCPLFVIGILVLPLLMLRGAVAQDATQDEQQVDQTAVADAAVELDETMEEYPLVELPPLKRIVMYNSGVGQMQHAGEIDGKSRLQIRFGRHDIDDILKSLVFEDRGGGTVRAVQYQPAPEPEDVAANQIGAPMTLAQLLQRFRGERISITAGGNRIRGTIYGVENRKHGESIIETLVLINEQGLASVALPTIDRAQFDSDDVRQELELAMSGIVKSRKANQKRLDLLLDGEGQRTIQFAYVVDMPIWRMTYRLSLDEQQAYLQGWAHVDNVTGVDWEQVTIELRSGRPQAFHINVFAPLMAERPDFGNSVYAFTKGLRLITQWFGFEPAPAPGPFGGGGGLGGGGFGGGGGGFGGGAGFFGGGPPAAPGDSGLDIDKAFQASATEGRAAQMVRYRLDEPVDLGAGKSAALPVFASQLPAKLLSVYRYENDNSAALRAIQIENDTDYAIVSGPISIIREGDFVGDGTVKRLNVGETQEIVYGIDRALDITRNIDESSRVLKSVVVKKAQIVLNWQHRQDVTFEIINKDTEDRNLVLHYQVTDGTVNKQTRLLSPEPDKLVDGVATFMLQVEATGNQSLNLVTGYDESEEKSLDSATVDNVRLWQAQGADISASDLELFGRLQQMQSDIDDVAGQLSALANKKRNLESEQTRVRSNIEVLARNLEAARPYMDKLQELENQIEQINAQTTEVESRLDEATDAKANLIDELAQ